MVLEVAYSYLLQGNLAAMFSEIMTNYPLQEVGLLWVIFGALIYGVWYAKTGDYAVPSIVLAIYLAMVSAFMAKTVWIVFVIVLAFSFAIMFYRLWRD